MCYQFSSDELLKPMFECLLGGISETLGDKIESLICFFQNVLPRISFDSTIVNTTWAKEDGIKYSANNCYVITGSNGTDPIFSHIVDVYVACGDILFLCVQQYIVDYFDDHFHSYVISSSHNYYYIHYRQAFVSVCTAQSQGIYNDSSNICIILKYVFYNV